MSKNSNRPGNGNGRGEFPVFAGILLGIVMGLALAATIAWLVLKKNPIPVPPAKEAPTAAKPAAVPEKPANTKPAVSGTASANNDGKTPPRFEFYKELTDKPDSSASKKTERHEHDSAMLKQVTPAKPAASSATYFLQEGAYSNMDDAEKVKAKLALLGMVASIQPANIPDKGIWYRVRLGPYKNSAEMNEALANLKLNGLKAAPIRAQ